jgi:hypothetical protein
MLYARLVIAGLLASAVAAPVTIVAQQEPAPPAKPTSTPRSAQPRTPWGAPDLQGTWSFATVTPLERPANVTKPFLTPEEIATIEKRAIVAATDEARGADAARDVAGAYNDFWWDRGTRVVGTRRTSLIVDPPDGKLPAMTPEAVARLKVLDERRERAAEGPEDRSVGERCIMGFNAGPPITTGGYNQNLQIVQTKDYVMLMTEMVHTARVVPLDGRPIANVPQWSGKSRGRWEGDTLVVESKSFQNETSLRGSSPSLTLTERYTRVDGDTLMYEYTVNDPKTWTKPWTVQIPMSKSSDMIYEYACHEANYGMTNLLKAARAIEKGFNE